MATESEVELFLRMFIEKMDIFDVVFLNRDKNLEALVALEITRVSRKEWLKELKVSDYFKGPTKDVDDGPEMWEFGKNIKGKVVYIKITMGQPSRPVICISFHLAERAIKYPFKK